MNRFEHNDIDNLDGMREPTYNWTPALIFLGLCLLFSPALLAKWHPLTEIMEIKHEKTTTVIVNSESR